ncbi:MAG TPA: NUDIX hydrolase [Gammaproteobacteria bacterium]|nr:NUDIX hydrolase [Gammaproteobacteria bacterium]
MDKTPMNGQTVYQGRILRLEAGEFLLPHGRRTRMEVVRHPGGVAIAALNEQGELCLVRQYRPPLEAWIWELPAGKRDKHEPPLDTARRELEEEAGLRAARWDMLGEIYPAPGYSDEVIHLFLARQLSAVPQRLEPDELLESHWIPLQQARGWLYDGTIRDAKSQVGIHLLCSICCAPKPEC